MSKFYTLTEVADILGISKFTLYQQSREGRLPKWMRAVRVGNATRFPKTIIDRAAQEAAA